LDTTEGVKLYHDIAVPTRKEVGIIDTHTHHNLRQIIENKPFPNIWRAEVLETRGEYKNCDHYIIQLAAKLPGFSQALARAPQILDYDKWKALCGVFTYLEGNHVHQWMHLDLRRMFGIEELLSTETADRVWKKANDHLNQKDMFPQAVLKKIGARIIFTTDYPIDDLPYHKMVKEIEGITFSPTFRPDSCCNIFDDKWKSNVEKICQFTDQEITLEGLVEALRIRHSYFAKRGAKASDHGLLEPYGLGVTKERPEYIFRQAYNKGKNIILDLLKRGNLFPI